MTAIIAYGQTRLCARLEQGLNTASMYELTLLVNSLTSGVTFIQMLEAQWKLGQRTVSGKADQKHLSLHVFGGKQEPWWGADTDLIATEGLVQTVMRMIYDLEGKPRSAAKRVSIMWALGGADHFHVVTSESTQQVSMLWVTPPKPDQPLAFEAYKQRVASGASRLNPKDLTIPDNFTRPENIWVSSGAGWALTHGVDASGKKRAAAIVHKPLTKQKGVVVTQALCEAYNDRFPQLGKRRK